jgi:hypothetical protein
MEKSKVPGKTHRDTSGSSEFRSTTLTTQQRTHHVICERLKGVEEVINKWVSRPAQYCILGINNQMFNYLLGYFVIGKQKEHNNTNLYRYDLNEFQSPKNQIRRCYNNKMKHFQRILSKYTPKVNRFLCDF